MTKVVSEHQPSLFTSSTSSVEAFTAQDVSSAWANLCRSVSLPPTSPGAWCYFHHKEWDVSGSNSPLVPTEPFVSMFGTLYLASELYSGGELLDLINGKSAASIAIQGGQIDPDIGNVLKSRERFRHSLSEHADYWVCVAELVKSGGFLEVYRTKPNIQPEDKGPDGVTCVRSDASDSSTSIHVHSVKSSTRNPRDLLASAKFRKTGGNATRGTMLEDFWLIAHKNDSTVRLHAMLEQMSAIMGLRTDRQIRIALLGECRFHGTVIADDQFADEGAFEGFQFISAKTELLHATYIGSSSWVDFADACRQWLCTRIASTGVTY